MGLIKVFKKYFGRNNMNFEKIYEVGNDDGKLIDNKINYCIGTGRLGLALRKEYLDQLKFVQEKLHFKYIRGHGIFSNDIGIYHEYLDNNGINKVDYNFTYLDMIMDSFKSLEIKPFLELGFMPEELSSGKQTVFFWKGNITYPKNENRWIELVKRTLEHLIERYGLDEVLTWPIEVWNEPNGEEFWVNADEKSYFKLFKLTFDAIKDININFKVGGPVISGIEHEKWIEDFVTFCDMEDLNVDFVSRHVYSSFDKETKGHYTYFKLRDVDEVVKEVDTTRKIIDKKIKYRDIPLHITEYNSTYRPDSPIHDTVKNAAYVTDLTLNLMNHADSYSYWTFGDCFEEQGIPFSQFYGGFGLVANHIIPKPTFWAFSFMCNLYKHEVQKSEHSIITKQDEKFRGMIWNYTQNNDVDKLNIKIKLPFNNKKYCVITKMIDENNCNPLKIWHDLGDNPNPDREEIELLKENSVPTINSSQVNDGLLEFSLDKNAVIYFECLPVKELADRGFDYDLIEDYK